MYSFAMTMFEIETGQIPWDVGNMEVGFLVARNGKRPQIDGKFPDFDPAFRNVMEKCWAQLPKDRWSMEEAVKALQAMKRKEKDAPQAFATERGGYLHVDTCKPGDEPLEKTAKDQSAVPDDGEQGALLDDAASGRQRSQTPPRGNV